MKKAYRSAPTCPKCVSENTVDVIARPRSKEEIMFREVELDENRWQSEEINGNGKYYCLDCEHYWKKYRGKKPYGEINSLSVYSGGFFGKSFFINLDLKMLEVESVEFEQATIDFKPIERKNGFSGEMKSWFLEELHKCDFLNWAEEYIQHHVMDGSKWNIQIEYQNYCEIKTGTNNFPPKWTKFCKTISKITNTDFY